MKKEVKTDVLILGAGIGGYETFRNLDKHFRRNGIDKQITIVDKNNYFTFVPMLHEAAAGSIEPDHCAIPLRELTRGSRHRFIKAAVTKILPEKKKVETSETTIHYEYCVVALGSVTNYFDIPGAKTYTHHVRSLEGAVNLHEGIIHTLEDYQTNSINLVVVGGGFTGVEVAGQFCDFAQKDIKKLYPHVKTSISIIESGDLLLKFMPDKVREKITARLKKRGVKMFLQNRVKKVEPGAVVLKDNTRLPSDITIRTAGFKNIGEEFLPSSYCENGRIAVTSYLTSIKNECLYAIGDIMYLCKPDSQIPYPQLAEAAYKEGKYVAKQITARIKNKKIKPFEFKPKGTLMPVGDWYGVLVKGRFVLYGPIAWWIRRTVYLQFMPGTIRKMKIAFDWTMHTFGFRYIIETNCKRKGRENI